MKKIFFLAFACRPDSGSEDAVGWNWILQASKFFDVSVVTKEEFKTDIEKYNINIKFYYVESLEKWHKISIYYEYYRWQKKAYEFIKELCENEKFDYLWYITFGNIILPSYVYRIKVPLIWGPVGGTDEIDKNFEKRLSFKEKFPVQYIRKIILRTLRFNHIYKKMCSKSSIIILRTEETLKYIPDKDKSKIIYHLETAFDKNDVLKFVDRKKVHYIKNDSINLIYTGQLIGRKNIVSLLDAFSYVIKYYPNTILNIVGDGILLESLEKKAKKLIDSGNVKFWGRCDRTKTLQLVYESDVYVFPSLIDTMTFSILEAMVLAKPIVCFDVSGMKYALNDSFAIKTPVYEYSQAIRDYAKNIMYLIDNDKERNRMGLNSKKYVEQNCSWDSIGNFIKDLEI